MITSLLLIPPTPLTAAAVVLLRVPADTTYRIGRAGFSNPSAAAVSVTAYLVTSGSPKAGNSLVNAIVVPAGSTYVSPELAGLVLPAAATLQCFGLGVVLYASGISIT